ncbi:MAG: response regulator [Acidobacteria bacterium]|nr:response regulator [Acidobacteriota bacterium]
MNQKLFLRVLEKLGHQVTLSCDGEHALEQHAGGDFDLILMDVQMPRMDGLQATLGIRKRERGTARRIPILGLTAHAMKGDRERCLEAGMDGYVAKPVRTEDLVEAIAGVLAARV